MKVSIALATYNGERYLPEQLESFLLQTRMPDELVVCDDASSDATIAIVEEFSTRAPFVVRLERNGLNLGYKKNFEKCIRLCLGDIVLPSDQDDVWLANKIERVVARFSSGDEMRVTINDQAITDSSLVPSGTTIFGNTNALGFGEQWLSAGCCTAMSRAFVRLALPFPGGVPSHDGWIHALATSLKVRTVIPEVLQLYRRHGSNTSSSLATRKVLFPALAMLKEHGMRVSLESWIGQLQSSSALIRRLEDFVSERRTAGLSEGAPEIRGAREAMTRERMRNARLYRRIRLMQRPRLSRVLSICRFHRSGGYESFHGFRSAMKDLLRPSITVDQVEVFRREMQDCVTALAERIEDK